MGNYDVKQVHGLHVVHDGPRQAPPLVLIHGSGASSGSWSPVVPALADRYHVIRIDLPGHGQSSGGYIATALAEQRPDLVGSLALISGGPSPDALLPQPVVLRSEGPFSKPTDPRYKIVLAVSTH